MPSFRLKKQFSSSKKMLDKMNIREEEEADMVINMNYSRKEEPDMSIHDLKTMETNNPKS
jgi:hypothetical protein